METQAAVGTTLKVLYGPPGTGKTWRAAREAVELVKPGVAPDDMNKVHRELVNSGQIVWVTFHPSFTYEDFVEGFRPEATEKGILYRPRPGPFRIACANVTLSPPPGQIFHVGQQITSSSGNQYEVVAASPDVVVLKNMKEVGKKGAGLHTPVSLFVIERLRNAGYKAGDASLSGTDMQQKKEIANAIGVDQQTLFGMTGPLRAVWEHLDEVSPPTTVRRPVVLVIDEINRADLSRVFGELITLLEPDKRLGAPEERQIMLPYSQTLFGVPQELHIVATMNTWDRSLAVFDGALRRRFQFEEVAPDPSRCASPYGDVDLKLVLTSWNRAIAAVASKDVEVGHAYFERDILERVRAGRGYGSDADGELRTVALVMRTSILPLLSDLFRQNWRIIDFVLGRDHAASTGGLISEVSVLDLVKRGGEVIDLTGSAVCEPFDWWNPDSPKWDPDRFRAALVNGAS